MKKKVKKKVVKKIKKRKIKKKKKVKKKVKRRQFFYFVLVNKIRTLLDHTGDVFDSKGINVIQI